MNKCFKLMTIISLCLLLPSVASSKRPPKEESRFTTDIIQKALKLEKDGHVDNAEDTFLELYKSVKLKNFREEYQWLAYMEVLRNIISFYYRQGEYKEANWYHREYSDELDEDQEESGMHAIVVYDVVGIAENLILEDEFQRAEDTFLYLTDRLEERLGYDHWLVRLVYKEIIALYIKMNNSSMAEEYNKRLNP